MLAEKPKNKSDGDKPKKPYRHRKTMQTSRLTDRLLDRAIRAKGFAQAEVVKRWSHIVGSDLAAFSVPISLKFPVGERMGATLTVRVESAFAPLVQHRLPHIIDMVNRYFGYQAVAKLQIKQGPLPKTRSSGFKKTRPLTGQEQDKLEDLVHKEDSDLANAIRRLGTAVYGSED